MFKESTVVVKRSKFACPRVCWIGPRYTEFTQAYIGIDAIASSAVLAVVTVGVVVGGAHVRVGAARQSTSLSTVDTTRSPGTHSARRYVFQATLVMNSVDS